MELLSNCNKRSLPQQGIGTGIIRIPCQSKRGDGHCDEYYCIQSRGKKE